MNRKRESGSGMFVMEMIVVVFFFMICASICILGFVKSDRMSRLAADRNQAVLAAQSTAEIWKLEGVEGLAARMGAKPDPLGTSDSLTVCQDRFQYDIRVSCDDSGMEQAEIVITRLSDKEELFSLTALHYERNHREQGDG